MCPDCGHVAYENPKIVVGAVVFADDDRVLMCRRAIEPSRGRWTLPAGYLELGETPVEGACREAWEEARARIAVDGLLAVFSIRRLSQVQLIYRARLLDPVIAAGPESLAVDLFAWDQIPRREIAFPSVHWALNAAWPGRAAPITAPAFNPDGADESLPA